MKQTVVVSDGGLKSDDVLRTDRGSIEEAIAFAVGSYALRAWELEL